jgi:hypothetical protein
MLVQIEHIPSKCDLLIVGLNVSNDSASKKSLWSTSKAPWELWKEAGIVKGYNSDLTKAANTCNDKSYKSDIIIGFTDLINEVNTDSTKVQKPSKEHIEELIVKAKNCKVKNICLLGDKVIDGFIDNYNHKGLSKKWEELKNEKADGSKFHIYGKIGEIEINKKTVYIFGMPFPTTVPIPNVDKIRYNKNMKNELKK